MWNLFSQRPGTRSQARAIVTSSVSDALFAPRVCYPHHMPDWLMNTSDLKYAAVGQNQRARSGAVSCWIPVLLCRINLEANKNFRKALGRELPSPCAADGWVGGLFEVTKPVCRECRFYRGSCLSILVRMPLNTTTLPFVQPERGCEQSHADIFFKYAV